MTEKQILRLAQFLVAARDFEKWPDTQGAAHNGTALAFAFGVKLRPDIKLSEIVDLIRAHLIANPAHEHATVQPSPRHIVMPETAPAPIVDMIVAADDVFDSKPLARDLYAKIRAMLHTMEQGA